MNTKLRINILFYCLRESLVDNGFALNNFFLTIKIIYHLFIRQTCLLLVDRKLDIVLR